MNLSDIFAMTPINRTAARVVSQKGAQQDKDLTRSELASIVNRLTRKQRLLRMVLRISTGAQHANFIRRMSQNRSAGERQKANPRAAEEYRRIGVEIQRLNLCSAEIRDKNRIAEKLRNQKGGIND